MSIDNHHPTPDSDNSGHEVSEEEVRQALGSAAGLFDKVDAQIAAGHADTPDQTEVNQFHIPTLAETVAKLDAQNSDDTSDKAPDNTADESSDALWHELDGMK